jgi:hypothetical protein
MPNNKGTDLLKFWLLLIQNVIEKHGSLATYVYVAILQANHLGSD